MKQEKRKITRALVSVSDKSHLESLVRALIEYKVEIISTGGTLKYISELGIPVTNIESVTKNPEAFGGRMKSISFNVASGLLYRRYHETDLKEKDQLNIPDIDLVVCNLYPFSNYVGTNAEEDILIENIDIGGPLMIRAAAKNYEAVTVLSDVKDYEEFKKEFLENNGETTFTFRKNMAINTFIRVADYDQMIANELVRRYKDEDEINFLSIKKHEELRYGENPHQKATVYKYQNTNSKNALINAEVLQGKELSFNNWVDADAAWRVMSDTFHGTKNQKQQFVTAVIKHANPCGLAASTSEFQSLMDAWNGDNVSSFGGIIATSYEVNKEVAQFLTSNFIEVVIAPSYSKEALELFSKKKNVRLLKNPIRDFDSNELMIKSISGGLLIQQEDERKNCIEQSKLVTKKDFTNDQKSIIDFGVIACKHLKSNGIALVYKNIEGSLVLAGTGMGQPNRLDSLKLLASNRAKAKNIKMDSLVLISDAFFPFADSIDVCHEVGIKAIVEPGGSIRDDEVIAACDKYDIAMMFTGVRHFRH